MPNNPYNNLLFEHIDGFEFFLNFLVQIISYLPLLQEGQLPGSQHSAPVIIAPDFWEMFLQIMYNGLQKVLHKFSVVSQSQPVLE